MFRAISRLCTSTRSLHQAVSSIPALFPAPQLPSAPPSSALRYPLHASPPSSALCFRHFYSSRRRRTGDEREEDGGGDGLFLLANKDPERPPTLFIVQPRIRPDSLLHSKLSEALNLANSLEEQRDGFYAEEFADKEPPPHVVVQNPLARSMKAHAGITRRSMINFLIYSKSGTIFWKSVDASGKVKNAEYLFGLMNEMVEEIGEKRIVQVVTDNAAAYKLAGKMLMLKMDQLWWVPCSAHYIDLMLEDICEDEMVKVVVNGARYITTFIYNHNNVLDIMRKHTQGRELLRLGATRFVSQYIALDSINGQRVNLIRMVASEDWEDYMARQATQKIASKGKQVLDLIQSKLYWKRVQGVLNVVEPLVRVLRAVDGERRSDMGYLYEAMDRVKELIKMNNKTSWAKWWVIIDKRWENTLYHDLHAADTYFGPGTVETVKSHIKALESKDELDAVFVNATLSGIQQRNLESAWEKPVLDRVGLIIEIFNAHAETKEAKLQSELAALVYKKSRLVRIRGPNGRLTFGASGEAQVVSARGRGSGGRGFISGAGETELQLQRRRIQERRIHLLAQIEEVRRTRAQQRSARRRHGGFYGEGLATVAVVGYTNAGKSTLVSALSQSDLYSDDRLFATVDPRLRSVILSSGRKVLLSDTVGFISDLPVQLVEAFHATLEEVVEADLLMHVLDSSTDNIDEQRSTVLQVLHQIGVPEEKIQDMIEVWNKIDLVEGKSGDRYLDDGHLDESCDQDGDSDDNATSELSSAEDIAKGELETVDECSEEVYDANGGQESEVVNEELGTFSEERDYMSSGEPLTDDETAYGLSSGEVTVVDELIPKHSSEEILTDTDGQQSRFPGECQPKDTCHVKTSAMLGIGLQEVLFLIDEKLNAHKQLRKRSLEPFDRKWRPSHSIEEEEPVVEQ